MTRTQYLENYVLINRKSVHLLIINLSNQTLTLIITIVTDTYVFCWTIRARPSLWQVCSPQLSSLRMSRLQRHDYVKWVSNLAKLKADCTESLAPLKHLLIMTHKFCYIFWKMFHLKHVETNHTFHTLVETAFS